jgi:hypothetical protein
MRRKKGDKFLDSKYNRMIVIAFEIGALLTIIIVTCAILRGDIISTHEATDVYVLQSQPQSETERVRATSQYLDDWLNMYGEGDVTSSGNKDVSPQKGSSSPTKTANSSPKLKNPSSWSKAKILETATNAINKTKGYSKNLTVYHKEGFNATVTECTGGSLVKSIANTMVGWVVKPVDETLSYKNGYATNSEGENVPILLPKRGSFKLSSSGVSSASAKLSGNEYVIKIKIKPESVGIGEIPTHNAASVGYLDVESFDLSFMEIDKADIAYRGSSVTLHINAEGYVTYAIYKVPLTIEGSAHKGSVSGSATFVGEQSETWTLVY